MDDSLMKDSVRMATEAISNGKKINESGNWWMWLSIIEFGLISLLIINQKFNKDSLSRRKFKSDSLKDEIDFDNIINSSFNSHSLYDELKVKCHPDRFPTDNEKNLIAQNIFQEITKNKTNVKRLLELKKEAQDKLNINL